MMEYFGILTINSKKICLEEIKQKFLNKIIKKENEKFKKNLNNKNKSISEKKLGKDISKIKKWIFYINFLYFVLKLN